MLKSAFQSGDSGPNYLASNGVDADYSTLAWTEHTMDPWWMVDIEESLEIQFVTVHLGGMTFQVEVSIGDTALMPKKNEHCVTIEENQSVRTSYTCVNGILKGRYVFLYSDEGIENQLYFYECEVYVPW